MSTKHTATFDGHVFKRTSENRVYPFVVIAEHSIERDRAARERTARRTWANSLSYWQRKAAGTDIGSYPEYMLGPDGPYGSNPHFARSKARWAHDAAERATQGNAQEMLAGGEESYVAVQLEAFDSSHKLVSSDGKSYYGVAGWTSRHDLADKLAAATSKRGDVVRAHIVHTEVKS